MMKKKGMTLVEVIISVGLISVVMIFLFNLLLDIQYQSNHSSYLKENQRNRALIIKRVEEDLMNNPLTSVSLQKNSNYAIIYFNYALLLQYMRIQLNKFHLMHFKIQYHFNA